MFKSIALCSMVIVLACVAMANADLITPVSATASATSHGSAGNLILEGESTAFTHNGSADPAAWTVIPNSWGDGQWMNNGVLPAWVQFDLAAPTNLTDIYLWNYEQQGNSGGRRGLSDLERGLPGQPRSGTAIWDASPNFLQISGAGGG